MVLQASVGRKGSGFSPRFKLKFYLETLMNLVGWLVGWLVCWLLAGPDLWKRMPLKYSITMVSLALFFLGVISQVRSEEIIV